MPNNRGGPYSYTHPTLCQYVILISYIKYMGKHLAMSFIICTFVLSMVIPTTGSRGVLQRVDSHVRGRLEHSTAPYNIYKHKKIPHH